MHAEAPAPVETQRAVHLEEVVVRADLNRSIALVDNGDRVRLAPWRQFDIAPGWDHFAGNDSVNGSRSRPDRVVNRDEFLPIGKECLDLNRAYQI